jgi:TolB-like protein
MYEMATGCRPFTGSTSALIFDSILNRQPQPVHEISPALPAAFGSMLNRLMAKSPQERYRSVGELSEALREVQRTEQMAAARKTEAQRKIPSIAVLPFANLSADPDNQYFSDGLSEDLITALARLKGLQVASRASAFRFRGGSADIREVGRQLNVEAVLDGSVRRSGQRLRITAELVNVADGYHLWSERYDREITDIFEIQDEITAAIVQKLEPTLAGKQATLTRRHSENVQAYDLYLKGRRLWEQRSESSLRAGLECFRAAIDLDPEYALAHAGVADSFSILGAYGVISPLEGRPKAEAAVKRALELDPGLAEPHFSMALMTCFTGDFLGAERYFRRALEIQPQSSGTLAYLGLYLAMRRRFDEARESVRKAVELDPFSPFAQGVTSMTLVICRAYEEALEHGSRALELQPNFVLGLWASVNANCALERWEQSIEAGEKVVSVTRRSAIFMGQLGRVYAMAGQKEKAVALEREARQRAEAGEYINPGCFLDIHTGLNDLESAYKDLLAFRKDGGNGFGFGITIAPVLHRLAADSRCAEILREMELLE